MDHDAMHQSLPIRRFPDQSILSQGECIYHDAQQELTAVSQDATRGFNDLRDSIINRTRSISLAGPAADMTNEADKAPTAPKDLSSDEAIKESETVLSRLRLEAGKRLKDLQKAEDAADEALLRFGSNLRDFLREAITIAPPAEGSENNGNTVLFESKDAQGKRVIHTSRFDAQLHVIHTSVDSFTEDPTGSGYEAWTKEFDIEKKTEEISKDLAKYPELRATMENLVPNHVPYAKFWTRYYYLRHSIEVAEARRRDLLKGKGMRRWASSTTATLVGSITTRAVRAWAILTDVSNSCVYRRRSRVGRGIR